MKKTTRLLILSVIATLAFTSAFAACGKKGGDNGTSSSSSPISSSDVGNSESASDSSEDEYVAPATVAEAISAGVANAGKVTNGALVQTVRQKDYWTGELAVNSETGEPIISTIADVIYEQTEGYFHSVAGGEQVTAENWYIAYGKDGVLWLSDDHDDYGVYKSYYESYPELVDGYAFEMVFDYTNSYYGVEAFVSAIYDLSDDVVESVEDGVYNFSLVYINEYDTKHEVSVSFTLNEESAMNKVDIEIAEYYMESVTKLDENGDPVQAKDENDQLMVDEEGNPIYETEMGYLKVPNSVAWYAIEQKTDGEVTVAFDPEECLIQSYKLTDGEGTEVSELALVAGETQSLNMTDINEEANLDWETYTATVVDEYDVEVDDSLLNVYVNTYGEVPVVEFTGYVAGDYTITLKTSLVSKTLTATVELPDTTEIYAKENEYSLSALTSANIYDDASLNFIVVANEYADASAEAEITSAPEGAQGVLQETEGKYTFIPDEGYTGEYVITITSLADDSVSSTLTVTVAAAPDVMTLFDDDKYQNVGKSKTDNLMVWIMTAEDQMAVMVTYDGEVFDYSTWELSTVHYASVYDMTYDAETKAITLTVWDEETVEATITELYPNGGYEFKADLLKSLVLNANYTLKATYMDTMATLEAWEELVINLYEEVAGEYRYLVYDDDGSMLGRWFLGLNADGTGAFYYQAWNSDRLMFITADDIVEFDYTVVEDGDSYKLTLSNANGTVEGFDLETVNSTITYGEVQGQYGYALGITFTFNGETIVLERN